MRIIDLSPPLSSSLAVWPGDVGFSREITASRERGQAYEASAIRTTVHAGAHADAPSHFQPGGPSIDEVPLDPYLGPCLVVDVPARGRRLTAAEIEAALPAGASIERLLLRTRFNPDPSVFPRDFPGVDPEAIDALADRGLRLLGADTPSMDPFDDGTLVAHRRLAARHVAILEGLWLENAEPGVYFLVALPLRIAHGDGAPVRAVLLETD